MPPGLTTTELAGELMRVVASLRRVSRRRVQAELRLAPLPEAQRELLLLVETRPGIGVAAAAAELGLAGNSVSTLVNALTEAGLLLRETDPADRRAVRLSLAPAGQRRLQTWRTERSAVVGEALNDIGAAERRAIEAALPALRALVIRLQDGEGARGQQ
jgi:DNA-binding MarR family transcriptional regulator